MPLVSLVGYTYRGYPMHYVMDRAHEFGYDAVELRDFSDLDFGSTESIRDTLASARELALQRQLTIVSAFLAPLPIAYDWGKSQEAFAQYLSILRDFGIPVLHTRLAWDRHEGKQIVSAGAREEDYVAVQQTLSHIASLAAENKVKIAIETHMGTLHDTAGAQLRIVQAVMSPWITASLDFANMVITYPGEDLLRTIRDFEGLIGYVHLKNVKLCAGSYDWNIELASGDINYYRILAGLKEIGYGGPLAIEYCGTGDPDVFAQRDVNYLRGLLSRLRFAPTRSS